MKLKNNIRFVFLLLLISVTAVSCKKGENPQPVDKISADSARVLDKNLLTETVRRQYGDSLAVMETGFFLDDTTIGAAAGFNISKPADLYIKFLCFKNVNGSIQKTSESPLLKGSFTGGAVKKMRLAGSNYDMLFYDSQSYFLGSGGGEIFAHLADFKNNKYYSAHFFTVPEKPVSLYLSPGIDNQEIRDLFIKHFKKDYPDLKIVTRDYNIE